MLIKDLVFKIISDERDYQDKIYGHSNPTFDDLNTIGDWVIYIEEYVKRTKDKLFRGELDIQPTVEKYVYDPTNAKEAHRKEVIVAISKVAALCVAALQHLGEPEDFDIDLGDCSES